MGLDIGDKTIGVAICDPLGITARVLKQLEEKVLNRI
jgi:RNase H-fold protein (predicted Holliday junction resolvase)